MIRHQVSDAFHHETCLDEPACVPEITALRLVICSAIIVLSDFRGDAMANTGTVTLKTQRLLLRKFHILDYFSFRKWYKDAAVHRFSRGRQQKNEYDCVNFFVRRVYNYYFKRRNRHYFWAVIIDGKMMGFVGFNDNRNGIYSIYYKLAGTLWHQGYMSEAVQAVMAYMDSQDCRAIVGSCDINNIASYKVMQNAGFRQVKTVANAIHYADGSVSDSVRFRYK